MYVLTNFAYYHVLTPNEVASYPAVGSETVHRLLGDWGARGLAVLVAVSTFGTTNGAILTGPRVTQAMAADGMLWKPLGAVHPKRETPALALWIQALLSCVWLWFANGFDDVSGWFVTTSWLFYGVTTATIFAQRAREKRGEQMAMSYRTPLYPLTPIVFLVVTARHHLERLLQQRRDSAHHHPARHGRRAHRGDGIPGLLPVAGGQACLRRASAPASTIWTRRSTTPSTPTWSPTSPRTSNSCAAPEVPLSNYAAATAGC